MNKHIETNRGREAPDGLTGVRLCFQSVEQVRSATIALLGEPSKSRLFTLLASFQTDFINYFTRSAATTSGRGMRGENVAF